MATITNQPGQLNFGNPGDTIVFAPQSLTGVSLPGRRTYKFDRLSGGSGSTRAVIFRDQSDITIAPGSIFDNANIGFEKCSRVTVKKCTFRNLRNRSGEGTHVVYANLLTDSEISENNFENQYGAGVDTCIFLRDPRRSKFNRNRFYPQVHEAIHIFWYSFGSETWSVQTNENEIIGIERHGIESQGCAFDYECNRNHVSKRFRDGINLSIATGGEFGNGSYKTTKNIQVDGNVCDNSGFTPSHWSQCMGIEAMGDIRVTNNYIVRGGQGIAYTTNSPGTIISGNKFKDQGGHEIVTDPPHEKAIAPRPENFTGNVFNYTGAIPAYAELIGNAPAPNPVPPPPPPAIAPPKLTSYFTKVKVEALPGAVIEKRSGASDWKLVTLDKDGFDHDFDFDPNTNEILSKWEFYYIQTANGFESDEAKAQIGINPDPQPMPTITAPTGDKLEIGKEYECKGTGAGTLTWGIDRLGDGAPDIASGTGASFKFTVPADSNETQRIEVKMYDGVGAAQPRVFALVKPTPTPTPTATTTEHEVTFTVPVDGQAVAIKRRVAVTATGERKVTALS